MRLWMLSGSDRTPCYWSVRSFHRCVQSLGVGVQAREDLTLAWCVRSTCLRVSHDLGVALSHLTIEIVQMSLNDEDTWTTLSDRTLGLVRPIDLTGASGRPELGYSESPTALFCGGFYLSPMVKGPNG